MKQSPRMVFDGSRSVEILSELRQLIRNSNPSQLMFSEHALMRKYSISRGTAGKILNLLAKEGLVERQRGYKTKVYSAEPITLLLPEQDFLLKRNFQAEIFRNLYFGILRGASEYRVRVETVAVPQINDCQTADFLPLEAINANSMLIVMSSWFNSIFPLLDKRRSQVVLIYQNSVEYGLRQFTHRWHKFAYNIENEVVIGLDYLIHSGCRRIGLIGTYLRKNPPPFFNVYLEWSRSYDMPVNYYELFEGGYDIQREAIKAWCRSTQCDGIVVAGTYWGEFETVQEMLGLPQEIKVFGCNFLSSVFPAMHPFPCCISPYETMGHDAVEVLSLRPHPTPATRIYSGQFEKLTPFRQKASFETKNVFHTCGESYGVHQ